MKIYFEDQLTPEEEYNLYHGIPEDQVVKYCSMCQDEFVFDIDDKYICPQCGNRL